MQNLTFPVTEIFTSIQGEGLYAGQLVTFIRLHGCNLDCSFCDEDQHDSGNFQNLTIQDIIAKLTWEHPEAYVVSITGGEPSIHGNLDLLINELQLQHYEVCVETNGFDISVLLNADYIVYSPKNLDDFVEICKNAENVNEIKFLVSELDSPVKFYNQIKPIVQDFAQIVNIYVQPINYKNNINTDALQNCLEIIHMDGRIRLSVQLHKFINVR